MCLEKKKYLILWNNLKYTLLQFQNPNQTKLKTQTNHVLSGAVEGILGKKTLRWNNASVAGGQEEGEK